MTIQKLSWLIVTVCARIKKKNVKELISTERSLEASSQRYGIRIVKTALGFGFTINFSFVLQFVFIEC